MLEFYFDNGQIGTLKGHKLSEIVEFMKKENTVLYDEHIAIFLSRVNYIKEVPDDSEKCVH